MSLARRLRVRVLAAKRRDLRFVLAGIVLVSLIVTAGRGDTPIVVLLIVPALAAIVLYRTRPWAALPLAVAVAAASPGNRALVLPVMVILYTIAGRAPWRLSAAAGAGAALVAIMAGALWGAGSATDHGGLLGYAIGAAALYAAAVALGLYAGAGAGSSTACASTPSASIASGICWPTERSPRSGCASLRSCTTSLLTTSA